MGCSRSLGAPAAQHHHPDDGAGQPRAQKQLLVPLSPQQSDPRSSAGERIEAIVTRAPGNDAPIRRAEGSSRPPAGSCPPVGHRGHLPAESFRDAAQVRRVAKALRVDLVDVLGARRPHREPAARRHDLHPADRRIVARCTRDDRLDALAGAGRGSDLLRRELREQLLSVPALAGASSR